MNHALALDALESVNLAPTSSLLWQRLSALVSVLEGNERAALIHAIAVLPLEPREAQWLRCSALAYLTRDPVWFARQAALTDDTFTADAVMTLLGLAWYQALTCTSGHNAFVQQLRDINAPHLQRLVASHISDPGRVVRAPLGPRLRVALYTPEIANGRHGGTTLTLNTMSVLASQAVDLYGFSAKEMSIPAIASYHGGSESLSPLPVEVESLKLSTPGNIQLSFSTVEFSLRSRFNQILQAIDAYAPDVVIFVGFMSPLAYHLYAKYPMVGLSVHALPPVAPVDVWLSADPEGDASCWPGLPVPQVFPFPFRFWPAGQATPVDRATVGLPAAATVLVTVGFRLDTEIVPPWSEQMLNFIEVHPEVHWLLLGVADGSSLTSVPLHPRILRVPPQVRPQGWLAMCDIYVNPPRMGGGGALAMAMEQGLSVVTFAHSDGGDKVGEFAVGSSEDYFAQLAAWVSDPSARRQAGDALKARFHARLDFSGDAAAKGLMQVLDLAIESFQQRMETLSA